MKLLILTLFDLVSGIRLGSYPAYVPYNYPPYQTNNQYYPPYYPPYYQPDQLYAPETGDYYGPGIREGFRYRSDRVGLGFQRVRDRGWARIDRRINLANQRLNYNNYYNY